MTIDDSYSQQLLLWCFPNGHFLVASFFLDLFFIVLSVTFWIYWLELCCKEALSLLPVYLFIQLLIVLVWTQGYLVYRLQSIAVIILFTLWLKLSLIWPLGAPSTPSSSRTPSWVLFTCTCHFFFWACPHFLALEDRSVMVVPESYLPFNIFSHVSYLNVKY